MTKLRVLWKLFSQVLFLYCRDLLREMKERGCTPINTSLIPQWGHQKRLVKKGLTHVKVPILNSLFCLLKLKVKYFQLGFRGKSTNHSELLNDYSCLTAHSPHIRCFQTQATCNLTVYELMIWISHAAAACLCAWISHRVGSGLALSHWMDGCDSLCRHSWPRDNKFYKFDKIYRWSKCD